MMKRGDDGEEDETKQEEENDQEEAEELDELDIAKIVELRLNQNVNEPCVSPIAAAAAAAAAEAVPESAATAKGGPPAKEKAPAVGIPLQPPLTTSSRKPAPASVPGAVRRGIGTHERVAKPNMATALGREAEPIREPAQVVLAPTTTPDSGMHELARMGAHSAGGIPIITNAAIAQGNANNNGGPASNAPQPQSPSKIKKSYMIAACVTLVVIIVGIVVGVVLGPSASSSKNDNTTEEDAGLDYLVALEDLFTDPEELEHIPQFTREAIASHNQQLPQVQAYQWLIEDPRLDQYGPQQLRQRLALATLYFATDGPNWFADANETTTPSNLWLDYDTHECFWLANWKASFARDEYSSDEYENTPTVCDIELFNNATTTPTDSMEHFDYHVLALSSYSFGKNDNVNSSVASPVLTGTLVGELAMLTQLRELTIEDQRIKGTIPTEIAQLSSTLTHISLVSNFITGDIPPGLFSFPRLLWLSNNERLATTSFPTNIGPSLTSLKMANLGQLAGATIPTELFTTGNLRWLDLRENKLEGELPSEIGLLGSSLFYLSIVDNRIAGSLPTELGNLLALNTFKCSSNRISGSIPKELAALIELEHFSVTDNSLTGTLPVLLFTNPEESNFHYNDTLVNATSTRLPSSRRVLNLESNKFVGSLPTEIGLAVNLAKFNVYNNDLEGSIPSEVGQLAALDSLDLAKNSFIGPIPIEIGLLENVTMLYMGENKLDGSLPSEVGHLELLEVLDFGESGISGSLPTELGRLLNLLRFDVADNALTATVPSELGLLANLTNIDLSDNIITGELPSELGLLTQLTSLMAPGTIFKNLTAALCKQLQNVTDIESSFPDCRND